MTSRKPFGEYSNNPPAQHRGADERKPAPYKLPPRIELHADIPPRTSGPNLPAYEIEEILDPEGDEEVDPPTDVTAPYNPTGHDSLNVEDPEGDESLLPYRPSSG